MTAEVLQGDKPPGAPLANEGPQMFRHVEEHHMPLQVGHLAALLKAMATEISRQLICVRLQDMFF